VRLSPSFALEELTRTSTGRPNEPTPEDRARLVALCSHALEPIRALLGVPLRVTSGYRSPQVNAAIGGARGSQHMLGEAADIVPVGYSGGVEAAMAQIARAVEVRQVEVDQCIVYPRGGFLHISYRTTGNRRELLRSAAAGGSGGPYSRWTP